MAEDKTNRRRQLDAQIEGTSASIKSAPAPAPKPAPAAPPKSDSAEEEELRRKYGVGRKKESPSLFERARKAVGLKDGGLVKRHGRKVMGKAC